MKTIKHKHATCYQGLSSDLHWHRYPVGGARALQLLDSEDHSPNGVATVNVPEVEVPDDCVLIKVWSENDGLLEDLIEAGVVMPPHAWVPCGFSQAALCRLTVQTVLELECI